MSNKVYWTGIEYSYAPSSKHYGALKGGFVYCFVRANDCREVLDRVTEEMDNQEMIPTAFEFISPYNNIEWETQEESAHYQILSSEALKSDKVVFDDYYAFKEN